jgi:hypothetical protein
MPINQIYMKTIFAFLILSCTLLSVTSCKKDNEPDTKAPKTNPLANMLRLGEVNLSGSGAKAIVYAADSLLTGYNEIFVQLYDTANGKQLLDGHFSITPMMDMGMMEHSAPVENTTDSAPENGIYKAMVVFSMPGSASEWSLNMQYHNHATDKEGEGKLGIKVSDSSPSRLINTTMAGDGDAKVLIALVQPSKPKTGVNDFEVVIHKKASMMSFPAVEDYTVEIEPHMPSMGHGSPNNVNPVHTAKGHYKGKVNFTMTGLWQIKLKVYKSGVLLRDDLYFETTL